LKIEPARGLGKGLRFPGSPTRPVKRLMGPRYAYPVATFQPRERRESDLERCVQALRLVHEADGYPMVWPKDPVRWLSPANTLHGWVAVTRSDAVAGHVLLLGTERPDTWELARLFVSPEARGLGLAGALLELAGARAAERGAGLELWVVADERSRAISLYERAGWRRTGTVTAEWTKPDGGPVRMHRYAR
jgi:GNAT superfamily N-acetyltransferase